MRELTPQELLELIGEGASIQKEDDKPLEITGFKQLVAQLSAMVQAQEKNREQLTKSIEALVQVIKTKDVNSDDKELKTLLTQIVENTQPLKRECNVCCWVSKTGCTMS